MVKRDKIRSCSSPYKYITALPAPEPVHSYLVFILTCSLFCFGILR
jgi:hypothetical protein